LLDYYKLGIIVECDVLGTVGRNLSVSFLLMAARRDERGMRIYDNAVDW